MKVCCAFSLESSHRGSSNEYTQYTIFNLNKKNTLNYPKSAARGFFSKGLRNEFETAVVNEPSVFEPLKFYCSLSDMAPPFDNACRSESEGQHVTYISWFSDVALYLEDYLMCKHDSL